MKIIAISSHSANTAAAFIQSGHIRSIAQERSFTGKNQVKSYPTQAVQYCLQEAGVSMNKVDYVAFYDHPCWYIYYGQTGTQPDEIRSTENTCISEEQIEKFLVKNQISYRTVDRHVFPLFISKMLSRNKVIGWYHPHLGDNLIEPVNSMKKYIQLNSMLMKDTLTEEKPNFIEFVDEYYTMHQDGLAMIMMNPAALKKSHIKRRTHRFFYGLVSQDMPYLTTIDGYVEGDRDTGSPRSSSVSSLYEEMTQAFLSDRIQPAIINMTHNDIARPLTDRLHEAYTRFMNSHMHFLALDHYLIDKSDQHAFSDQSTTDMMAS